MLGRAHSLFGDPPASGQGPAAGSVMKLSGARELVRSGQAQMAPLSGQLATNYSTFAGGAGPALDTLAGNDRALSTQLDEAARADRTGRTSSGTVVNGAAADTNGLAPFTNTPAGQKHSWSPCASASPNNNKSCRPTKPATRRWRRCCGL